MGQRRKTEIDNSQKLPSVYNMKQGNLKLFKAQ